MLKSGKRFLVGVIISVLFLSNLLFLSPVRAEESLIENIRFESVELEEVVTDLSNDLSNNIGNIVVSEEELNNNDNKIQNNFTDETDPEREVVSNKLKIDRDPNTGALLYNYPINIPSGRNNLTPELKLFYNSQLNNQNNNIFGYGWDISIPYIERINKKGLDKIYTENYFKSSLSGELIYGDNDNYLAKVDDGEFLEYRFVDNEYWQVKNKIGLTYIFGQSSLSRQDDPQDNSRIYKWQLEKIIDINGNYIFYEYFKDGGQIYPNKIKYINYRFDDGIFEIEFIRELKPDVTISYDSAFRVKTGYRVKQILVSIESNWVRKYDLFFSPGFNGSRSLLNSIIYSGRDEQGIVTELPAEIFTYQVKQKTWIQNTNYTLPFGFSVYNSKVFDFNGDGLLDIILGNGSGLMLLGKADGTGWVQDLSVSIPSVIWSNLSRLSDVNGDGFVDIIYGADGGNSQSYINNGDGTGWTLDNSWFAPYFGNSLSLLTDLNGDSLPDILRYDASNGNKYISINTGYGWSYDSSWVMPIYGSNIAIFDYNGDGLPDIIYRNNLVDEVYLNNGSGWILDPEFHFPFNLDTTLKYKFIDYNGDGLDDFLVDDRVYNNFFTNNGNLIVIDNDWRSGGYIKDVYALTDFEGNNTVDIMGDYLRSSDSIIPDLLSEIKHSDGGNSKVEYKSSSLYRDYLNNNLNLDFPMKVMTVDNITIDDGWGNEMKKNYEYRDGFYYYNGAHDKKFAGFGSVKELDEETGYYKIDYFHQGNETNGTLGEYDDHISKMGKPYRIELYDSSGNLYKVEINKWEKTDLGGGANYVYQTSKTEMVYDGNSSHKDRAETYSYDLTNGNLLQKKEWGEVNASTDGSFSDIGSDIRTTNLSYSTNSIVSLPKSQLITDQNNNKVAESRYYYDNLPFGQVDKGNLTKEEKWQDGSNYVNTQKQYNSYGLVTSETDANGNTTNYTYDSYNLYPTTITNALSQSTQYQYDYSLGKPKQIIDANNYTYQTIYDGLDRVIAEKQPDIVNPGNLVNKATYTYTNLAVGTKTEENNYLDDSNIVKSYTYTDGLNRVIQKRQEIENADEYLVVDYVYNNLGQLEKESLPYLSLGVDRTSATTNSNLYNNYNYDPVGRIISIANVSGTTSNVYDDNKTTIIDANGKSKNLYTDVYGNLIKVEEINGTEVYTTQYGYDSNNNLIKITDALSNIRNFEYNGLGQRVLAEDLHHPSDSTYGVYYYSYDNNGNLNRKIDPRDIKTIYSYDALNRLSSENYIIDKATDFGPVYTYDNCLNGVGRLCSIVSPSLTESKEYNALGQISQEVKNIDNGDYQNNYSYDRQENLISIINPDNSETKYEYNNGGVIEKILYRKDQTSNFSEIISDIDYSPNGQMSDLYFNNGAITHNTYDPNNLYRLSTKTTIVSGKDNLQNLNYSYDNVGNITQIVDSSDTNTNKTINFTYDDLYRLIFVQAINTANNQDYNRTYGYNAIGNIMIKSDQGEYVYSNDGYANPHAVTAIGNGPSATEEVSMSNIPSTFNYDHNGNLISDLTWNYAWDYNNRLIKATNDEHTAIGYSYDSQGNRIKLDNESEVTIFPNKYYNIKTRENVATKQIFINDQLIATVENNNTYFVHNDHLGGTNVVTDSNGEMVQTIDYYPFGAIRFDNQPGDFNQKRKYTGHEYDQETDLNYMGARYQSGQIGRFISVDPASQNNPEKFLSDPQQLNMYSYARNNPLYYVDPTGMYNIETGQVEKGDTQDSIVNKINQAFNINTDWATVQDVSFYKDRFQDKTLDQICGQTLYIGQNITTDITKKLDNLNQSRANLANLLGKGSLLLFVPNAPWDMKNSSDPILGGGESRVYKSYVYNGELIRYDAPGNINYGSVAKSLGLSNNVIRGGAQGAQFLADGFGGDGWSWKDNGGDSAYVQTGINNHKSKGIFSRTFGRVFNNLFK